MIRINEEQVIRLHERICALTGGEPSLRDRGLLESAVESAYQSFGGEELYPTILEKGARLGFNLVSNHAFVDGNKRIGMLVMLVFLELNGAKVKPSSPELARVGLSLAAGEMGYPQLLAWLEENKA